MANWCEGTVNITGDTDSMNCLESHINGLLKQTGDAEDKRYCWEFANDGETDPEHSWVWLNDRVNADNGKMSFWYERKWSPPVIGLMALSRAFPTLSIDVGYSVEGMWDAGNWHIQNGHEQLTEHYRGYLSLAKDKEPVHHWVLGYKSPQVRKAIEEAHLAVPAEAVAVNEIGIRDREAVESLLAHQFPDEPAYLSAYTLHEEVYLDSVQTLATIRRISDHNVRRMMKIAEKATFL